MNNLSTFSDFYVRSFVHMALLNWKHTHIHTTMYGEKTQHTKFLDASKINEYCWNKMKWFVHSMKQSIRHYTLHTKIRYQYALVVRCDTNPVTFKMVMNEHTSYTEHKEWIKFISLCFLLYSSLQARTYVHTHTFREHIFTQTESVGIFGGKKAFWHEFLPFFVCVCVRVHDMAFMMINKSPWRVIMFLFLLI